VLTESPIYPRLLYTFLNAVQRQRYYLMSVTGWLFSTIKSEDEIQQILHRAERATKGMGDGLWQLLSRSNGYTESVPLAKCRPITPRHGLHSDKDYGLYRIRYCDFVGQPNRQASYDGSSVDPRHRCHAHQTKLAQAQKGDDTVDHHYRLVKGARKQEFYLQWHDPTASSNITLIMEQFRILCNKSYYGPVLRGDIVAPADLGDLAARDLRFIRMNQTATALRDIFNKVCDDLGVRCLQNDSTGINKESPISGPNLERLRWTCVTSTVNLNRVNYDMEVYRRPPFKKPLCPREAYNLHVARCTPSLFMLIPKAILEPIPRGTTVYPVFEIMAGDGHAGIHPYAFSSVQTVGVSISPNPSSCSNQT
jgi:hypothetical protein